jgi:hypothetical protein
MNKLIFLDLGLIPVLMLLVPSVYAGGPRGDSSDIDPPIPGSHECWVDGYDAGFAGKYDKDRADGCIDKADEYNGSWIWGCKHSGLTENECNDIRDDSNDNLNHASLYEENRRTCYDDGYEDGKNNPYDHERDFRCEEYGSGYHNGFIAGCMSVDNTKETCEKYVDLHQQASTFTQFHFDVEQPITNGTQYKAEIFDDDGEYLRYIWTYNGGWQFSTETSISGIWDHLENVINMSPTNEFNIDDKLGMFAMNASLPLGEPVRLCINDDCQRTTVDVNGKAYFE